MKSVGALAPSSRFLVKKMLATIDFSKDIRILELGPGTGVITKEILQHLSPNSKLTSVELNEDFCKKLEKIESNQFELIHGSAETIDTRFTENSFDYIISGLPLAIFKKDCVENIIAGSIHILKSGGSFIQFQYSFASKRLLQRHFSKVDISLAAVNLPPAVVYRCKK